MFHTILHFSIIPGLQGEVLYIARRELRVTFDFDHEAVQGLNIVKGEFYIYKRMPRTVPKRRKSKKPLPPATVSVHQTIRHHRILGETLPLDSRWVMILIIWYWTQSRGILARGFIILELLVERLSFVSYLLRSFLLPVTILVLYINHE